MLLQLKKIKIMKHIDANYFEHVSIKNKDKTPARARRTGKTKLWKREPNRFKIPVKHGLRNSFYITNENMNDWIPVS